MSTTFPRSVSRWTTLTIRMMDATSTHREDEIRNYYAALYDEWGAQHWWPAETQFEVVLGAYLTQNTAWTNVERALANLRNAHLLSVDGIRTVELRRLQQLIRPSGYFRQKAARLKTFVRFLDKHYGGSLEKLFSVPIEKVREELLALNGVGPETADSILLYAGNHPVFVVDAYTRRILERHRIVSEKADYEYLRELFQVSLFPVAVAYERKPAKLRPPLESGIRGAAHLPSAMSTAHRTALAQVYNEMHGLIVGVGKNYCRKSKAACEGCPLRKFLPAK
ncbi:MAG TPA: endonuclease III domain-containing protein [Candidatus Binatia bacterium]|nr:endonuclease III domain-containing protein [Candidatus Binatia bacterium]